MKWAQFSVNLTVKDFTKSLTFSEDLGFSMHSASGGIENKWLK
ncbi:hypothetical protein [Paraglaciecola sp. MB-3u-78]|jgi:predicted lactoylglutathione lyase|nr:hypothetical protein [Paraglaciecola sp. MB-3u-78]